MPCDERVVFRREHRAGDIQQPPAPRQQRPQRREQRRLASGERRDVAGAAQQADVRCRRITPLAEHGASTRMRSNGSP
ncbi:MAG: hypothetical protein U5K76_13925 [Woeseiaceae bacterium]|nr:hypothetical protein [Woeseiaceae bacterium]